MFIPVIVPDTSDKFMNGNKIRLFQHKFFKQSREMIRYLKKGKDQEVFSK